MTQPPYGQDPNQPNPYGQPPKKSKAGLIALVTVLALVLVGGILAAILLVANSDGDDDEASDDKTSQSTDDPTDEAKDEIDGDGYSYDLPDEWTDRTVDAAGAPGAIDTVSVWGQRLEGGRANLITEKSPSSSTTDPEDLRDTWFANMKGGTGTTPEEADGVTIDDLESIGALIERNEGGVDIVQRAYLVIHDGSAYSIGFSYRAGDDEAPEAFDEIIDSWSWE